MQFALAYNKDKEPCCGSDSYIPIDGRYGVFRSSQIANDYFSPKTSLRNDFVYFRICKGSILSPSYLTGFIKIQ